MATAVGLRGLSKKYDGTTVVDDLHLDVAPGTLTALLGPSGCGKTTTLRIIAGLLEADAGEVEFDGTAIGHLKAERRPVAMVFQKPLLFPHLSVGDNVAFGLRMRKVPRAERAERVDRALALVRLEGFHARRVGEMSGGQEQRVALARALVTEPSVLLLDEPFSALDASLRLEVRDLVRELQQELGVTTLFVTHDQEEAVSIADHVALMLDGRLVQHDVPRAFYDRPASLAVARFFGGRNELPAFVSGGLVSSALGQWRTEVRDGPAVVSVRPEAVLLVENGLPASVRAARYLGTHVSLELTLDDGSTLQVSAPPGQVVPPAVHVHVPPSACTVVEPL